MTSHPGTGASAWSTCWKNPANARSTSLRKLPPSRGFFYAIWLYNSPHHAEAVSKSPAVTSNKKLAGGALLPSNAAEYHTILLTRETQTVPPTRARSCCTRSNKTPGRSVPSTQGIKPPVQPKLDPRIGKIAESAMPADFRRMVPTKFALAVIKEGTDLLDPQLSG